MRDAFNYKKNRENVAIFAKRRPQKWWRHLWTVPNDDDDDDNINNEE